jgi:hypothetical protein
LNLYGFVFNNSFTWYDYLGREPVKYLNIIPRQDSSVPDNDPKVQKNLEAKANQLNDFLNEMLDCCCELYEIGCDVDSRIVPLPISATGEPKAPDDGNYGRKDQETLDNAGDIDGNNIPMTFTDSSIMGGANGAAAAGTGVLIDRHGNAPFIPPSTLAHELGHAAGYRGNDPNDAGHDIDPEEDDPGIKGSPLMGPKGGDQPSRQWCEKVSGLAK